MAEKLSTGFRDFVLGRGSSRDFLSDSLMRIYSGTAPASADDAVTGVLLVQISQASLADLRDGWGEIVSIEVTSHAAAETFGFDVTIGAEAVKATRVYTNTPDAGTVADVAVRLVKILAEAGLYVCCTGTTGLIYCMAPSRKSLTIALTGGMTGSVTVVDAVYAADAVGDLLNFGAPSSGSLPKTSDVWSGLIGVSGVAGYFRLVQADDDGTLSTTEVRAQGAVATSGAELNLSNTSLVAGTTLTIDSYSFSQPAE